VGFPDADLLNSAEANYGGEIEDSKDGTESVQQLRMEDEMD